MLSQDEQRRLRGIEWTMSLLDPRFADGLRDGTPCAPNDDRRWPFLAWAVGAVVVMFVGLGTTAWFFAVTGGVGAALAAVAYRRHVYKVHGRARPVLWHWAVSASGPRWRR